jgi:carbonic anhydrase
MTTRTPDDMPSATTGEALPDPRFDSSPNLPSDHVPKQSSADLPEAVLDSMPNPDLDVMSSPAGDAWRRLAGGNRRWACGRPLHPHQDLERRRRVATAQAPSATVLSSVDSRVPPELVFDVGLGDLLVVRTPAHTMDEIVAGAMQFGSGELETPLFVVLGHQHCGAATIAARHLAQGSRPPGGMHAITQALRPAFERARGSQHGVGPRPEDPEFLEAMVRAHVHHTVELLGADPLLRPRLADGRLAVVGAYYAHDTGSVERIR